MRVYHSWMTLQMNGNLNTSLFCDPKVIVFRRMVDGEAHGNALAANMVNIAVTLYHGRYQTHTNKALRHLHTVYINTNGPEICTCMGCV